MAETIENNVRRLIIDEIAVNPKYYEKMSALLDALIAQRRQEALDYKAYLTRIVELTRKVSRSEEAVSTYPSNINSGALRALYDNLEGVAVAEAATDGQERQALVLDRAIRGIKKADWRGNRFKEREVRNAVKAELGDDDALVDTVFEIVKAQREY